MSKRKRGRGPGRRVDPAILAVAEAVTLRDFADLHGISIHKVRTLIAQGLPVNKYPHGYTVPRELGGAWLIRFRSDRVGQIVDDVMRDLGRAS
jgi:hypothetical protein